VAAKVGPPGGVGEFGGPPGRAKCEALVVGGGITGAATAWYLSRAGVEVILVERSELGSAASGANAGSLHAQLQQVPFMERGEGWARDFAPASRFLLDSIQLWRGLGEELGEDLEVAITGGIMVADSPDQLSAIERKVAIEHEQGLASELLSAADLRRLAPYIADGMAGGEFCPDEGKANPLLATAALAGAAVAQGAQVIPRTELVSLAREDDGFRAATSRGDIACRKVVSCGGVDAGAITAMAGAPVAVAGEPIQAAVTEAVAPLIRHLIYFAGAPLTLKQARAGSILIGGGWPARLRDRQPLVDRESLLANLTVATRVVPDVAQARLLRTWAGFVNATASWLPLIGELPGCAGLFIGAFPYMGFTAAPLVGRTLAELVCGRRPEADISPFAP
jgi:glycine/D-amino acid oxidase-like deaminating enzyme